MDYFIWRRSKRYNRFQRIRDAQKVGVPKKKQKMAAIQKSPDSVAKNLIQDLWQINNENPG